MDLIIKNNTALWGTTQFKCTIGENGFTSDKTEGDGKTPIGSFLFRRAYYRPDRIDKPQANIPLHTITKQCGWCDDPTSDSYNRYIQKPFEASHERLWLDEEMYDLLIVVGHNDSPPEPYKGSAIFIHLINPNGSATKGCIGLEKLALLQILAQATPETKLVITY